MNNMIRSRSAYTRCARSCRREYDHAFMKQKVDDARLYWQLLDKLDSNTNTGESNLTADEFYGYFKSLNNPEDVSTQGDDDIYEYLHENLNNDTMFEKLNNTLDVDEVKNAIREIKTGKAAGHDLNINELYINASEVLAPVLTCLFNNVFTMVIFLVFGPMV